MPIYGIPFARNIKITVKRPEIRDKPTGRRIWGWAIRRTRLERGRSAGSVATELRVTQSTLHSWERHLDAPSPRHIPLIIDWLGFVPWELTPSAQTTTGKKLVALRELRGLTQREFSALAGICLDTLISIEKDRPVLGSSLKRVIEALDA
jgi:transcriptional regulator with XRE-family HTH domain